jgi:hypothetical protein
VTPTSDDPLRTLLLRLAELPELQDRFIFDPVGLMSEAGLGEDDQELLLSGDVDAINTRVWPEGRAPRNGPVLEIEIVDSEDGRMPLVRNAVHPVVSTYSDPQVPPSSPEPLGDASSFVGSVATAYPGPLPIPGSVPPGAALPPLTDHHPMPPDNYGPLTATAGTAGPSGWPPTGTRATWAPRGGSPYQR